MAFHLLKQAMRLWCGRSNEGLSKRRRWAVDDLWRCFTRTFSLRANPSHPVLQWENIVFIVAINDGYQSSPATQLKGKHASNYTAKQRIMKGEKCWKYSSICFMFVCIGIQEIFWGIWRFKSSLCTMFRDFLFSATEKCPSVRCNLPDSRWQCQ